MSRGFLVLARKTSMQSTTEDGFAMLPLLTAQRIRTAIDSPVSVEVGLLTNDEDQCLSSKNQAVG